MEQLHEVFALSSCLSDACSLMPSAGVAMNMITGNMARHQMTTAHSSVRIHQLPKHVEVYGISKSIQVSGNCYESYDYLAIDITVPCVLQAAVS